MKIAYIFEYFGDGGTEENTYLLAEMARRSGHDVVFIINNHSKGGVEKLKNSGFEVISLSMSSSFNPWLVLRSAIGLKKIAKVEGINIVHAQMLREHSIAIISKILGAKFSLVRGFHRLDQFNWKMKPFTTFYLDFTEGIIATSKLMQQTLFENGWNRKVRLVENGVSRVCTSSHERALGFIGRLANEKGILNFVESNIDILRHNKLVIAGDGPDTEQIKKIVSDNKLNVELMGRVSNKLDFYSKISVLILPSETEVLPLVVLEAYSCGIPVAAFDIKPLRSLITKNNGILVDYPNYKDLGEKSLQLLKVSSQYRKANIERFEKEFSADIMWGKTLDLYRALLKK